MPFSIRESIRGYQRDSYLGGAPLQINSNYAPIDCLRGYSPWGVSPLAVQAYKDFDVQTVSRYGEMFYASSLQPAITKRFGLDKALESQLFLGHGSFNLVERFIHKLLKPGTMLGVGPQFNEIPSEYMATGGRYVPVPVDPSTCAHLFKQLTDELTQGHCSVLYLDNPNNPLGYQLPLKQVSSLVRTAGRYGTIVIIDEAYGDFVDNAESAIHLVRQYRNLAVIRSFSKCLGLAAERVGYMFLSAPLAQLYVQLDVPFEPSVIAATMARATLSDHSFIEFIRREALSAKVAIIKTLKDVGYDILPTHPGVSIFCAHKAGVNIAEEM